MPLIWILVFTRQPHSESAPLHLSPFAEDIAADRDHVRLLPLHDTLPHLIVILHDVLLVFLEFHFAVHLLLQLVVVSLEYAYSRIRQLRTAKREARHRVSVLSVRVQVRYGVQELLGERAEVCRGVAVSPHIIDIREAPGRRQGNIHEEEWLRSVLLRAHQCLKQRERLPLVRRQVVDEEMRIEILTVCLDEVQLQGTEAPLPQAAVPDEDLFAVFW